MIILYYYGFRHSKSKCDSQFEFT